MDSTLKRYLVSNILEWASTNGRNFPWRLNSTPYRICIAEILLQQTTARKVAEVYDILIKKYPNVGKLSRARVSNVRNIIDCLGLTYRAKGLKIMAKQIMEEYQGIFPKEKEEILKLYGVGEYAASAILCFAYGEQVTVFDTNTIRLYSRFFGIPVELPTSKPGKRIFEIANSMTDKRNSITFNYAALDFSAIVCKHYNPNCSICPVNIKCKYDASR